MMPSAAPTAVVAAIASVGQGRVHVVDGSALAWQATGQPGLQLKAVRNDDALGHFLGLVRFEAFVRSGQHQHQGVASSFVLDGGLTDYQGSLQKHQAGINQKGSTHDAMAYEHTVLVSRLEAPVAYLPERGALSGLHAGSHHQAFENATPEIPADFNVTVDALPTRPTGWPGVQRQTIFDYAGTGLVRRFVQLSLAPQCAPVQFACSDLVDVWVRGGELWVHDGAQTHVVAGNGFVVLEPGAQVTFSSPFGALLLAWANGPERPGADTAKARGPVALSLFGF
jgi:hypothetical protein